MDKGALGWAAAIFAIMALVTTTIISITVCGMMANNVVSIMAGVVLVLIALSLGGFAVYTALSQKKSLFYRIVCGVAAFFSFISGILACTRTRQLYTTMSRSARAGYGIMIPMGMFLAVSPFWLPICRSIFGSYVRIVPDQEMTQLTVVLLTNVCSAFISGMFIGLIENFELETEMLVTITLRSIGSAFISAFIGSLAGVFLAFKAEKAGYTLDGYEQGLN